MRLTIFLSFLILCASTNLQANNIQVSNVSYTGEIGDEFYQVHFDISWENSWRTSSYESNYDAAWVFVKYKGSFDNIWYHGHVTGGSLGSGGAEMVFPSDSKGFFIQRDADGIGDVSYSDLQIDWELDFDFFPDETIEVCVYAIEMVYIPEGPFQVGDGDESDPFRPIFEAGNSGLPFAISSENALNLGGTSVSNLSNNNALGQNTSDDFDYSTVRALPAAFPKGYQAFYAMKYEISQGQYAAFLSSINQFDAASRYDPATLNGAGQTIEFSGHPSRYGAELPDRAAAFLSWIDFAMYADWSGLRPMSELEFEKICRGPLAPVSEEYAWGNSSLHAKSYEFEGGSGLGGEVINPGLGIGNALYSDTDMGGGGAKNCGMFSMASMSPDRQEAGASYYGVLEMSGNVAEIVVSLGTPEGRLFDSSSHGDGTLNATGVTSWPDVFGLFGTEGLGSGTRGGGFNQHQDWLRTSSRYDINLNPGVDRFSNRGGRLVRSNF